MNARFAAWPVLLSVAPLMGCGAEEQAAPAGVEVSTEIVGALRDSPCDVSPQIGIADSAVAGFLTGARRLDAEVYDCQRLVVGSGTSREFGPLVGVFPVESTLGLGRPDFATGRPAAAIFSWGAAGGAYTESHPELVPTAGVSCLWLRNATGTPTGWQAAIVGGRGCGGAAEAPPDSAFVLPVFERVFDGSTAADYPRTARWQWDPGSNEQFIGLKCGDAWCAVAGRGASEPRTQALEGGDGNARESVPGWSDAQHLAVYDSAAGRARPGPWASVVAYRALAAESPPWAEGILAARITVYGDAGAFAERFYLQPGNGSGHDDLILRFPGLQDEAWLQQGPMRRRQASRIRFSPAMPHPTSGTVRWRWSERGEGIWSYCPSGTCAIDP